MREFVRFLSRLAFVAVLILGAGETYVRLSVSGSLDRVLSTVLAAADAGESDGEDLFTGYLLDPEIGYRRDPRTLGRNVLGLRGRKPIVPKPADVFRILVLGDSISTGKRGFVTLLGRRLSASTRDPRIEVFNASVRGYTIVQKRQYAERIMPRVKPDLVLLAYTLDDNIERHQRLLRDGGFDLTQEAKRAYVGGPIAGVRAEDIGGFYSFLALELKLRLARDRMVDPGPNPWDKREDVFVAWQERGWPVFTENLGKLNTAVSDAGARLGVVMFPFHNQLDRRLLKRKPGLAVVPQTRASRAAEDLNIPVLDLHPVFVAHGDRSLFSDGFHLSDDAQRIVSEAVLDWTFRNGLLARDQAGF